MLAVTNVKILTITKGVIENGMVLIDSGKIKDVGKNVKIPKGAKIINGKGKYLMPGMIDAHCHTGIFADGVGWKESDGNEMTDPITPQLRAIDAIHPEDIAFQDLREAGITTINTGPGSANLIGGTFVCMKTKKTNSIEKVLIKSPSAMKMALGENPKSVYGPSKRMPSTRMGNAAVLREALVQAQEYINSLKRYKEQMEQHKKKVSAWEKNKKKDKGEKPQPPAPPARNLKHEALIPVLEGKMRCMIHCHRADDIITAIRIAEEFKLYFSLEHCTEGYKVTDILSKKKIPCVVGPIIFSRSKYELREMTPKNPAELSKAGVKIAIQTDEMSAVKYMLLNAGLAVKYGMKEEEALKAITIYPAEIIGVEKRVGSIEKGKDGDLVLLSGYPFDYKTNVDVVIIDGEVEYSK
ncbi:MAG: amidohydrolase [bacterium]|nr:amidohydrolase [bacterium]